MCTYSAKGSAKATCAFSNISAVSHYKPRMALPHRFHLFESNHETQSPRNSPKQQEDLTLKGTTQKMHSAFTTQNFHPNVQFTVSDIHSNRQLPMNWKTKCFF